MKPNKLTADQLSTATEAREALAKSLGKTAVITKRADTLNTTMQKLKTRREKAESKANEGNVDASMELLALADQERRLSLTIEGLESGEAAQLQELHERMNEADQIIGQDYQGLSSQLESEVARALEPFGCDSHYSKQAAHASAAGYALRSALKSVHSGGDLAANEVEGRRILAKLDVLLAGEALFDFEAWATARQPVAVKAGTARAAKPAAV